MNRASLVRLDRAKDEAERAVPTPPSERVVGPATAVFSSDVSIGTALRETYRLFCRTLGPRLQRHGVTLSMWFVLRELWAEDGLSQAELGRRTGTYGPAIVGVAKALMTARLVRRRRGKSDRRVVKLYLTRRGKQLEARLTPLGLHVNDSALCGFTETEKVRLLSMLKRLRENLSADEMAERDADAVPP